MELATLWYSWFGFDMQTGGSVGSLGSSHWNNDVGTWGSRVGITEEPVWGFYASDDPEVIAKQLDAMQRAGISVVLISWFGWGDSNLDGRVDSPEGVGMHRATLALLEYIRATDAPLQVAIIVEPFVSGSEEMSEDAKRLVLDFLWDNVYAQNADLMYAWEGKPLLGSFMPLDLKTVGDPRYTVKVWGSTNDANWKSSTYFDWNGYPDVTTLPAQISDDGVLILFPRFDEYWAWVMGHQFAWEPRRVDPLLTEGVYERAWQVAVDHRDELRLLVVYSWNEHGDHSAIEPTRGRTHLGAGWSLVDKTAAYFQQFRDCLNIQPLHGSVEG